ncbi:MAG: hypothetical protein R6X08_04560 [Desulfosalsimonadaceae bacterium]
MANLLDSRFRRTKINNSNEITLDSNMLTLLTAVDERKSLRQVAAEAKLEPKVFKESLTKLLRMGLIEQVRDERDFLDQAFLERARDILVELAGPLGETLVEDGAEDLSVSVDRVPKSDAAELVHCIAQKLPGDKEQGIFKKRMLEEIKKYGL